MLTLNTVRLEALRMKSFVFAKRFEAVVSTDPDTTFCLLVTFSINVKPLLLLQLTALIFNKNFLCITGQHTKVIQKFYLSIYYELLYKLFFISYHVC